MSQGPTSQGDVTFAPPPANTGPCPGRDRGPMIDP
jgi:hypothetical protein